MTDPAFVVTSTNTAGDPGADADYDREVWTKRAALEAPSVLDEHLPHAPL